MTCLPVHVLTSSNGTYHVNTLAVFNTQGGWTWNRFHPNYLSSQYLSSNSLSLSKWILQRWAYLASVQMTLSKQHRPFLLHQPKTNYAHLPMCKVFPLYSVRGCQKHTLVVNLHILHVVFLSHRPLQLIKASRWTCTHKSKSIRNAYIQLHKPRRAWKAGINVWVHHSWVSHCSTQNWRGFTYATSSSSCSKKEGKNGQAQVS